MLSKKTKYGLKAMALLASQQENTPMAIACISESENISHKYLESILLTLKKAGFVAAKKGKGGGYYLLIPADKIPLVDLIRVLEGPIAMLPCVSLNFYEKCADCPDEATCSVHQVMLQVRDNTLAIFRNTSLADIA